MAETPEFYIYPSKTTVTYSPEVIKFQKFKALPNYTINHIIKNASNIINQKLYRTCKFFLDCKIFYVVEKLTTSINNFYIRDEERFKSSHKIWLIGNLLSIHNQNSFPYIFSKLAFVNVRSISLSDQNIFYNEFLFLVQTGNVENFLCFRSSIKYSNKNGNWVEFADILEKLPALEDFSYLVDEYASLVYTPETTIKLAFLIPFTKLSSMIIGKNIPETFINSKFFQKFLNRHSKITLTNHYIELNFGRNCNVDEENDN